MTQTTTLNIKIPEWLSRYNRTYRPTKSLEDRMRFVIEASQRNIEHETGGPFAAGVFDSNSGELLALGVNLVSSENLSILHAEVLALSLAQRKLNTFDLNQSALELELITSTEPCAMCLGAIPWSGIRRVVTAASGQDAEAIGFDEGDKPENWQEGLTRRGIEVITRVCPDEAKAVLNNYAKMNGPIYNSKN